MGIERLVQAIDRLSDLIEERRTGADPRALNIPQPNESAPLGASAPVPQTSYEHDDFVGAKVGP